ncbi:hypothetical protein F5880DRAFT_1619680 [Lentinula raphanica]|nr:hypothetical protein F5880DRAFT_1619680 [Lentinula raphanica]
MFILHDIERTKVRPLASGAVSMAGAYIYLISLTLAFAGTLYMLECKEAPDTLDKTDEEEDKGELDDGDDGDDEDE